MTGTEKRDITTAIPASRMSIGCIGGMWLMISVPDSVRLPIETPYLTWRGMSKDLLTYFVQRAILGIEACIPAAVQQAATARKMLTPEIAARIDEPTKLGSKSGIAHSYYNLMPALVHESYSLRKVDQRLWVQVRTFYEE